MKNMENQMLLMFMGFQLLKVTEIKTNKQTNKPTSRNLEFEITEH